MGKLLNNLESIWSRGNSPEEVWETLQSKEEQLIFYSGLSSRLPEYPTESWEKIKGFALMLLKEWSPGPNTLSCWHHSFDDWDLNDQIVARAIAVIDKGIGRYVSDTRGYLGIVEEGLIYRCLEVMAAGVRPGSGARNCHHVLFAGFLMFGRPNLTEAKPNWWRETFWKAVVRHNKIGLFGAEQGYPAHSVGLDIDTLVTMYQAKEEQLGKSWPSSFSAAGLPSLMINIQSDPDLQTMVILTMYHR